jgi:hypothetical protein
MTFPSSETESKSPVLFLVCSQSCWYNARWSSTFYLVFEVVNGIHLTGIKTIENMVEIFLFSSVSQLLQYQEVIIIGFLFLYAAVSCNITELQECSAPSSASLLYSSFFQTPIHCRTIQWFLYDPLPIQVLRASSSILYVLYQGIFLTNNVCLGKE